MFWHFTARSSTKKAPAEGASFVFMQGSVLHHAHSRCAACRHRRFRLLDLRDARLCRQQHRCYGRSILENSSFIASSVNPDPDTHGRGYVGRLSGSTAEMLSLWKMMFVGNGGFEEKDGKACFRFAPLLRADLFDENGEAAFTLCGSCCVVYHNKTGRNTYGENKAAVRKIEVAGKTFAGDLLPAAESAGIRSHSLKRIDVWLS